jgi:magnesium transporter
MSSVSEFHELTRRLKRMGRASRIGAPPGTLVADPDQPAAPSVVRVMAYGPDRYEEKTIEDLADLPRPGDQHPVLWINVDGTGDIETLRQIGEAFHVHHLVLEDMVNVPQRPKAEPYDNQLFLVTRMPSIVEGRLRTEQVSLVLSRGLVLTVQERPGDCFDPVRSRIRQGRGFIRRCGADYLAYALLDAVTDAYFPVLEQFGEELDALEAVVIDHPTQETIGRIHRTKRDLLSLRRVLWPKREVLSGLVREQPAQLSAQTLPYLRDTADHAAQLLDILETFRELAGGLLDAYMSAVSNRMNAVMKVLTIIATIFIPLSFIAGVYGMNFSPEASPWNMPELSWRYGYPFALGLMTAIALAMLAAFWWKGWLRGTPAPRPGRSDH